MRLSPEAATLFEMWHDHAQLAAQPDIISVRDAFSILLLHPQIFNGYLPGDLQEAFLTILGGDSAQQIALHAQSFLRRNSHSAQRAAPPPSRMPVRDAGTSLGADNSPPRRGQRRPASPTGRTQRRRVATPLASEETHRRRVSAPRRPSAPPLELETRRAASQPAASRASLAASPSAAQQALLPPANAAEQPANTSASARQHSVQLPEQSQWRGRLDQLNQPVTAQPAAAQSTAAQRAPAQLAVPVPASEPPAERATVGAALASEARVTVGAALASETRVTVGAAFASGSQPVERPAEQRAELEAGRAAAALVEPPPEQPARARRSAAS